jgi:hypothetical protein
MFAYILAIQLSISNILPYENYNHWSKLKEVCESRSSINGKPVTYSANEYVKSGSGSSFIICRWALVPFKDKP